MTSVKHKLAWLQEARALSTQSASALMVRSKELLCSRNQLPFCRLALNFRLPWFGLLTLSPAFPGQAYLNLLPSA